MALPDGKAQLETDGGRDHNLASSLSNEIAHVGFYNNYQTTADYFALIRAECKHYIVLRTRN